MDSPADEPERRLVERAKGGDAAAFRELYLRHAESVHRFAILPLVRDRTLAEDLLADTFLRAFEHLDRFAWQGRGILPWLIRIGKNLCLDHLRKSGRYRSATTADDAGPEAPAWDGETLLAQIETDELLRHRIDGCLVELNPRYRQVVQLRLIEKRSRTEAAEVLGITVGTLDVLLFRACRSFRRVYVGRYGCGLNEDPEVNQ